MPNMIGTKQLNILHAEDNQAVYESCKKRILDVFEKENLLTPKIENIAFCNGIFRKMLEMKGENKVYDILLLDLELRDGSEYNGLNAINEIIKNSPHTKIFVLSGNIYDPAYSLKLQQYKDKGKIVGFFETSNYEKWCGELIRTVKTVNVGVLHFSDMHITPKDNSRQILTGFADYFQEKADLVIFSGDIANHGEQAEFTEAGSLLENFCNETKIKNFICVPGNHDIKRDVPANRAFSGFLYFRNRMEQFSGGIGEMGSYPDDENYADYLNVVKVYPGLRTIVWGLNSAACIEDDKFGYSYGEVTARQIQMAENKLKEAKEKYPNYLVIATFHHNIFEPPYYFDHNNTNNELQWIPPVKKQGLILKQCFENGVNLLLVGHSHVSSSYSLYSHDYGNGMPLHILSAGLFSEKGVTPLEPQLTINYLTYQIDLGGNVFNMHCQPYKHKLTDGTWHKAKAYGLSLPADFKV